MTDTILNEQLTSGTAFVDAWLEEHGAWMGIQVIDFALDVRDIIADLERRLADTGQKTPVAA